MTRKPRKRPDAFLSRARAFFRVAAKKRIEGDQRGYEWYQYQAEMALRQSRKARGLLGASKKDAGYDKRQAIYAATWGK